MNNEETTTRETMVLLQLNAVNNYVSLDDLARELSTLRYSERMLLDELLCKYVAND